MGGRVHRSVEVREFLLKPDVRHDGSDVVAEEPHAPGALKRDGSGEAARE